MCARQALIDDCARIGPMACKLSAASVASYWQVKSGGALPNQPPFGGSLGRVGAYERIPCLGAAGVHRRFRPPSTA
jgi:hypothetical protein